MTYLLRGNTLLMPQFLSQKVEEMNRSIQIAEMLVFDLDYIRRQFMGVKNFQSFYKKIQTARRLARLNAVVEHRSTMEGN